jgi:hypothetical protein
MKKKTALVYFLNGLIGLEKEYNIKLETINKLHKLYFEASEMEKKQIIKAYEEGYDEGLQIITKYEGAQDYYTSTYE